MKLWLAPEWAMLPLAAQRCRVRNPLNGAVAELTLRGSTLDEGFLSLTGRRTKEEQADVELEGSAA